MPINQHQDLSLIDLDQIKNSSLKHWNFFFYSYFEDLAVGVWNTFDVNTDDLINGVILLRIIPYYNIDLLEMAVEGDSKKFVSHSSIQNLLTDIWHGNLLLKPKPTGKLAVIYFYWIFIGAVGTLIFFCSSFYLVVWQLVF